MLVARPARPSVEAHVKKCSCVGQISAVVGVVSLHALTLRCVESCARQLERERRKKEAAEGPLQVPHEMLLGLPWCRS